MVKTIAWIAHDKLAFQLVHNDEYRLMKLRPDVDLRIVIVIIMAGLSWTESKRILIGSLCKHQQMTQIDSIGVFDKVEVVVTKAVSQHA